MAYYNTCSPHNNAYSIAYSYPVPQPSTFTPQGEIMPLTQRGQPDVSPLLPYDRQHIANPPHRPSRFATSQQSATRSVAHATPHASSARCAQQSKRGLIRKVDHILKHHADSYVDAANKKVWRLLAI